jgi:hypothetical protein
VSRSMEDQFLPFMNRAEVSVCLKSRNFVAEVGRKQSKAFPFQRSCVSQTTALSIHPFQSKKINPSNSPKSTPYSSIQQYDNLQRTSSVHRRSGIVRNFFILYVAIRTTTDTPLKFLTKNSRSKQTTKKSTATHTFTGNRPQL